MHALEVRANIRKQTNICIFRIITKNVPLSLAKRHQVDVAYRMMQNRQHVTNIICGPTVNVSECDFENGKQISRCLKPMGIRFSLLHCDWIDFKDTKYRHGCFLAVVNEDSGMPVFVIVLDILVIANNHQEVIFFCEELCTDAFSEHSHAWIAKKQNPAKFICIRPTQLLYYLPLSTRCISSSASDFYSYICSFLISTRYRL